jgi:hypothetical protein
MTTAAYDIYHDINAFRKEKHIGKTAVVSPLMVCTDYRQIICVRKTGARYNSQRCVDFCTLRHSPLKQRYPKCCRYCSTDNYPYKRKYLPFTLFKSFMF